MEKISAKTIRDFGAQWSRYQDNEGFYGSIELLRDVCGPLFAIEELRGHRILDVGSGTGRFVNIFLDAGAAHVVAVEPSDAIHVLKKNVQDRAERVTLMHVGGEHLPDLEPVDFAFSYGVLHHIPHPEPVVRRVYDLLKPGGKFLFWVYGWEGNQGYLRFVTPLRKVTALLPDLLLAPLSQVLTFFVTIYCALSQFLPLPLHDYMHHVVKNLDWRKKFLTIFDQLNPAYAKYYRKEDAYLMMQSGGFGNIQMYHRHGYSWTVIGEKPIEK